MRKLLFIGLIAFFIFSFSRISAQATEPPKEYPQTFVVVAADHETDLLTLEDFNGYIWHFEGAEDWFPGDIAAAIMSDNGTSILYDDTIQQLRYSGYIGGTRYEILYH